MRSAMLKWRLVVGWLMAGLAAGATAQTISQPVQTFSSAGAFAIGQSFTATRTGTVVAIDVRARDSWVTTLHLYNGEGSGVADSVGTPAYSQPNVTMTGVAAGGSFTRISLAVPFPVIAGNEYTFMLDSAGLNRFVHNAGNLYPGGRLVFNYTNAQSGSDLAFQIFETSGTVQTIAFANPGGQTAGTGIALAATATSGLVPTFASTTPAVCTVTPGGALALVGAGTCTITADQAGNGTYGAAPQVAQSFAVLQAAQTLTFASPAPQAFGTTPTLAATASSGLLPTFTSATPAVCTVTPGGVLTFITPGNCTVNADQPGNGVFAAAPQVARTFAVLAAVATTAVPTLADGALALLALLLGTMAWVQLKRR